MVSIKLKQLEYMIESHKANGYLAEFDGWRVHKVRHHSMKEEFISSNRVSCFGAKSISYMDIVPHGGNVECARCHQMLSWTKSYPYALYAREREMKNVIFGCEETSCLYCGVCMRNRKGTVFEMRVRSFLDVDAFQHLPIKRFTCTSLSNKNEVLRIAQIYVMDTLLYISRPGCSMMLPNGILPQDIRERILAKRVIRTWSRLVMRKKVAYVLYRCINNMDKSTACSLAKIAVQCN